MHVLYDGHIFRWQKAGGISRYFRELIARLPPEWVPTLLGVEPGPIPLPRHPRLATSPLSSLRPRRFSQQVKCAWWRSSHLRGADLFHPTYYTLTGGLKFSDFSCPIVVTVHDLIGATYPHLEANSREIVARQREAIRHAAHVVCVSHATERDLLRLVPEAAGKTSVIHHGSSFPVTHEPQPDDIFDSPTFLFVGGRATYKNFLFLLRAFSRACREHPKIRLHIAGPPLTEDERWQIHLTGLTDRITSSVYPDEATLYELYRRSVAFLYPSRHEGFGIPPLEALACGTLVLCSNVTSLPEVVGDAGIMLDPADEDAWAHRILQVANQQVNRAELITRGLAHASQLTWEKSAHAHIALYRALLHSPRRVTSVVPEMLRA